MVSHFQGPLYLLKMKLLSKQVGVKKTALRVLHMESSRAKHILALLVPSVPIFLLEALSVPTSQVKTLLRVMNDKYAFTGFVDVGLGILESKPIDSYYLMLYLHASERKTNKIFSKVKASTNQRGVRRSHHLDMFLQGYCRFSF